MGSNVDDYWNRSGKAFNFDDDDIEDDMDLKSLTSFEINLGGGDDISEASFNNSSTDGSYNLSIKSLLSDDALKTILDEQSMDDNLITKGMKPEEELKILRRQIQNTLYSPSPATVARKLLSGKVVPFEVFKSLEDKQNLLDAVISIGGGGDAVLSVVLFLEKSLNHKDFRSILKSRPKALQNYIAYLTQRQVGEAIALLTDLGKYNDAMLLEFETILSLESLAERKSKLLEMMSHCANNRVSAIYQQLLHASLKLFGLVESESNNLNNLVNANSSPIEVLYACCAKHSNWKEPDIAQTISPYRLCSDQHISSGQFDWTALNERAQAQAYKDLQHIFEHIPTWHPMKQKQFHINISLELAVLRLHELGAPSSVLYMFLSNMGNATEKLDLAKRVKCTKSVIDALASLKDVTQLLQLRDSLAERSEEQFYCDNAIKTVQSLKANSSPIEVLYACCAKHSNWKEPDIAQTISPYRLCSDQHISSGQFDWTALNERAQAQAYKDLQHIFEHIPTWHPMKQKQFHINISLELAVLRLHELGAPSSVLYMFLSNMGNATEKLDLAKRVKCTKSVIDALASLKDVTQLLQLRDSLAERSEEQFYCDNAIKTVQSKRWTTDSIKLKL